MTKVCKNGGKREENVWRGREGVEGEQMNE